MALNLHPELRQRLIDELAAALAKAEVIENRYISAGHLGALYSIKSLPAKGELFDRLAAYIGEWPFATFALGEILGGFRGGPVKPQHSCLLSAYPGYEDLGVYAAGIVEAFGTLPWRYMVTLELPRKFSEVFARNFTEFECSPRHRICLGSSLADRFPMTQPPPTGQKGLMWALQPDSWSDQTAYLQVEQAGYIGWTETEPVLAARDDVLSFFGLAMAMGVFDKRLQFDVWRTDAGSKGVALVHQDVQGNWIQREHVEIDEAHWATISQLTTTPSPTLIGDERSWLTACLKRVSSVLSSPYGRRISLAAKWLFESNCGRDALLRYVQAAVAMEILLGDEEPDKDVTLSTLMSNRVAYLIGRSPAQREDLKVQFKRIYQVRSKIVHRGKSRLSLEEQLLFGRLQSICMSVINAEQRILE